MTTIIRRAHFYVQFSHYVHDAGEVRLLEVIAAWKRATQRMIENTGAFFNIFAMIVKLDLVRGGSKTCRPCVIKNFYLDMIFEKGHILRFAIVEDKLLCRPNSTMKSTYT